MSDLSSIKVPFAPGQNAVVADNFAFPWSPDQGDGTYRNPIIYSDYSDPDVVRVGDVFYMVSSSFNCTPGLPILLSKDLVNWRIIGHAINNLPHPRYSAVQPGCGVWAPSLRLHDRKFWIFFPMPDEGIYVVTAEHPAGPWSAPHLVQEGKGLIDPCPLWDDDGNAYLVHAYAYSRSGIKHRLRVRPMAPDGSRLLGEGVIVFHEPERHPTLEGPKFLKKDGWYYILAPAGGVETGWQTALRSKNIYGPYEDKIVLEQGGTAINGPHQGALVETANGEWWFVHFQHTGVSGRITHLQPVKWENDWPMIGAGQGLNGGGAPVLRHTKPSASADGPVFVPQTSDEFDSPKLGLQWQWHANHDAAWYSLKARKNWLRLYPQLALGENLGQMPNLLLQKFPAPCFTVEILVEFTSHQTSEETGLVVTGITYAALAIRRAENGNHIIFRNNGRDEVIQEFGGKEIKLRTTVFHDGLCSFNFAEKDEAFTKAGEFQATPGRWIGAKIGVYSLKRESKTTIGHADLKYFRFLPPTI